MTFAQAFFRIYDRKIASGEISFKNSGISMNDFNQLCIVPGYHLSVKTLTQIRERMKFTDEEFELLCSLSEREDRGE